MARIDGRGSERAFLRNKKKGPLTSIHVTLLKR